MAYCAGRGTCNDGGGGGTQGDINQVYSVFVRVSFIMVATKLLLMICSGTLVIRTDFEKTIVTSSFIDLI
jgi:hypothetical protein